MVNPTIIPTHLGDWKLQLKACLNLTGACTIGPIGIITVLNPCLETNINGGYIGTVMQAPILGTDQLNLKAEMGPDMWPFFDTVDMAFPALAYNCGMIKYIILDTAKRPLPQPPIVTLSGDILTFTPRLDDPVGEIPLILRAYMVDYNNIYIDRGFFVKVTACQATLSVSNSLNLPNKSIVWGDPVLPYSISSLFSAYVQTPNCGY